ncbi:hypothetical protein B1199_08565 [Pseudoalteromonas ulvae]|uniref:DUF418 domain-containing protein n=1 Tax=Pseudoalteromonas ulvae TaxID=107327 RepID=A0A244CSV3_PSEDV|nr:hypothetical protein B1199_08565 [Pseudoalteromonas ulvae]
MTVVQVRLPLLDVFRGFAIFGIFFINITIMHCLFINQDAYFSHYQDPVSQVINRVLQLFFYNKFFPIFSFLFGFGLATQMLKKRQNKQAYIGFFSRRMLILLIFGLLHIHFLWSGDVLHLYAILGFLCLFLIHLKKKALIWMAVVLLSFPFYEQLSEFIIQAFPVQLDAALERYSEQGIIDVLRHGNYHAVINLHWHEYLANLPMLLFYLAPIALSMFLLGIAAGKSTLSLGSPQWVSHFQKTVISVAVIGVCYKVCFLFLLPGTALYTHDILRPLWFKLMFLSDITLGLCYLWGLAWLWHRALIQRLLMPLSYIGRMALTNYLLHSVVGLFLFTHLGLGLYQTLSPAACFAIALAVFFLQACSSAFWLRYFQYGPCEWLWRCGSYGTYFNLRRIKSNKPFVENNRAQ